MKEIFDRQGFIYCLQNPSMPGICKIGATRKHPIQRARELGTSTGVPTPYTLAYYRDFSDCFLAETILHRNLASKRVNESREFFEITVGDAVVAIDGVVKEASNPSEGLTGGSYRGPSIEEEYPWAALFASFDPNGPLELTPEEQARCRALERSQAQKSRPSGF